MKQITEESNFYNYSILIKIQLDATVSRYLFTAKSQTSPDQARLEGSSCTDM